MKPPDVKPVAVCGFSSADEFRARPHYRADVAETRIAPLRIVGHYRLAEAVRCGIRGCEQMHEHGYVVQVDEQTETNSGWDCGLDHFSYEFVALRQQYDRAEREYPRRIALHQLIASGDQFRELIETLQLRPYGGNWLLRNLRRFEELYPADLIDVLRRNSEKGDVGVVTAPLPARIDIAIGDARNAVIRQPDATVRGLRIFRFDTDRWPLFEIELELEEFLQLDVDTLTMPQVANWAHWAETLETRLTELEIVIDEGKKFFRRGNLSLLQFLADDPKSRELLSWIVFGSDFPQYQAERTQRPLKNSFWHRNLRRLLIAINQ